MSDDYDFAEEERSSPFIELGHLSWLIKHALMGKPSIGYGFMDGLLEHYMSSIGCTTEDMVSVAAAFRRALNNSAVEYPDLGDISDGREVAR